MYVCMYVSMYLVCIYIWMDGWMYGCMDGCMDGWMYGCMDVWMYGCMYVFVLFCFVLFFFPYPFYYLRPSVLSLLVVTQIRGHIAVSSPLPTTVRALHFYREKISALSSLVDSRRIVLTHARRSQQLILFLFSQINSKSRHGGIRTHGPTLVAFEGCHTSPPGGPDGSCKIDN